MSTSPASPSPTLASLSAPRKLLLASGVLLLIVSFLPWYRASAFGLSFSQSGWHQIGTVAWLLLIITLIVEGVRVAGVSPLEGGRADLATAAAAGLTLVFGVIYLFVRLFGIGVPDGVGLAIGFWLGLILMAVFAYATFQLFQASGGQAAVREVQAEAAQRRAQQQASQQQAPPATPPVTPPATPPTQQPPAGQQPPASTPPAQQPPANAPQDPPANS